MEEAPKNGKESLHSAHATGINEWIDYELIEETACFLSQTNSKNSVWPLLGDKEISWHTTITEQEFYTFRTVTVKLE